MLETAVIATVLLGIMKYLGVDLPWYALTSPLLVVFVTIALSILLGGKEEKGAVANKDD